MFTVMSEPTQVAPEVSPRHPGGKDIRTMEQETKT
jgi:hypothetical protein